MTCNPPECPAGMPYETQVARRSGYRSHFASKPIRSICKSVGPRVVCRLTHECLAVLSVYASTCSGSDDTTTRDVKAVERASMPAKGCIELGQLLTRSAFLSLTKYRHMNVIDIPLGAPVYRCRFLLILVCLHVWRRVITSQRYAVKLSW